MSTLLLRRFFGSIILLALLVLGVRPAQATHLLGGEMSYRYLDANGPAGNPFRYEITVTIYSNGLYTVSNPNGIAAYPNFAQVEIYNQTTGTRIGTYTAQRQGVANPQPVLPPVPAGCAVVGPNQPFYLLKYVQTVNLPVSFDGYYAVYSVQARNNTITNISNPGNTPLTLFVSMAPPLISNSSPVFSDTAVAIVCQNDTTITLNNAFDADGDRLVYSFGSPYGQRTNVNSFPPLPPPVTYNQGYSVINPFGGGAGNFATINASTGVARYGATANGLYVVAVDVSEYRNINGREVLIGTTRRDLQLVVSTCPPTPPPLLPPAVVTPRSYTIEEGQSLSIPITATQASNNPLVMTVNSALLDGAGPFNTTFNGSTGTVSPGNLTGTATATGTGTVTGTFVFNSACGNARATPYDLGVTVKDNGCGGRMASDIFRITVTRAVGPNAINGPATVCDPVTSRTYTASGPVPASYNWRVVGGTITGGQGTSAVQVTWASANTTGTLVLKGISSRGCPTDSVVKTVDIRPLPALTVTASSPTICLGGSSTLSVAGIAGLTYVWSGGGQTSTSTTLMVTPTTTTTYTVVGTDGTCNISNSVTVTVTPPPTANPGPNRTICPGVPTPLGAPAQTGYTYTWSPATGLSNPNVANSTLTLPNATGAPIVVVYTLTVSAGANCSSTQTVSLTVSPAPVANAGPALTTCQGVASTPLGTPALAGYTYSWSPAAGLSNPTAAQPTVTLPNATNAPITATYTLTATNADGCTATSAVVVTVSPAPVVTPGPAISFCSATTSAPLGGIPVAGSTYSWSPTTGLSNPNILNPTVTGTNTTGAPVVRTYTLTTTSADGCMATGTVSVTINPAAVADTGPAKQTCPNVGVAIGGTAVAGTTYAWAPATGLSSTSVLNPTVTLPNTGTTSLTQVYTLTATTANGCMSSSTVAVTVNPAPTVNAGPDVAVCDRRQVTLGTPALAGYTYSWSPAAGLSSATAAQPVFTGTNTTANPLLVTLTLTATSAAGCVSTDAVVVTVNPRPAPEAITGPISVCPTVTGIAYSVPTPTATAYTWLVTGGTIASGQGTPAITVNWRAASNNASVKVFHLNAQGCSSDTTTLLVIINQRLQTVRPTGPGDITAVAPLPQSVCQSDGPYTYRSGIFTNGSSYAWEIIGGTQVSTAQNTVTVNWAPVTVPTIVKIVVTETSNPAGGICRGISDTLKVLINPSPQARAIAGPTNVCQTSSPVTFSLPGGLAGAIYVFQLTGATSNNIPLTGTGSTRTLATIPAPGTYMLTVRETSATGCTGPAITMPFTVSPTPVAPTISGSGFVCNTATRQSYAIANPTVGATYQWTVVGGTITAGGSASQVTVQFNPTGPYSVSASEISASPALCPGPLATRTILFDSPDIALTLGSVDIDTDSDNRIVLRMRVSNSTNTPNLVQIMRRVAGTGAFAVVGQAPASATTYTDSNGVNADANTYEYRLDLTNGCGTRISSTVVQTVRLVATAVPGTGGRDQGSITLTWNAYVGAQVSEYIIARRADAAQAIEVRRVPGNTLQATISNTDADATATGFGFEQNFRVIAFINGTPLNMNSFSNEASVRFEGLTKTYNIITPNGDRQNDVLVIDNIQLHPGNTFTVFNRWGREIYSTTNYQNNWGGDDKTPAGSYFYLLKLSNGTNLKNWFEIVK
ncbi:gliding motility-associated C-terminal domain-containing protein [Hymenobacter sp. B1770]|uniref:T9SS type B sorting domain-containing protein n=1 Tax=Hymenobacter sp. B1770 TaxID=1718788 RepID=UPI003CF44351